MNKIEWLNRIIEDSRKGDSVKFYLYRCYASAQGIQGMLANVANPSIRFATMEPMGKQIPEGIYSVDFTPSQKFNSNFYLQWKGVPIVENVAGRSGIRIHVGNYPKDSSGCLLIGTYHVKDVDMIAQSKIAYTGFMNYCQLLGYKKLELSIFKCY